MGQTVWARRPPPESDRGRSTLLDGWPRTPADVSALRRHLGATLDGARTGAEDIERVLLVFEELTSNGLRHGWPPVHVVVTATARGWLLEVSDGAADPTAHPGRRPGRRPWRPRPAHRGPDLPGARLDGGRWGPQARVGPDRPHQVGPAPGRGAAAAPAPQRAPADDRRLIRGSGTPARRRAAFRPRRRGTRERTAVEAGGRAPPRPPTRAAWPSSSRVNWTSCRLRTRSGPSAPSSASLLERGLDHRAGHAPERLVGWCRCRRSPRSTWAMASRPASRCVSRSMPISRP